MIERWVEWVCSPMVLWAWTALAGIVFVTLFKVTAPYGRHDRQGWGPSVPPHLGWFLMEIGTLIGMAACFWVGGVRSEVSVFLGLLYAGHYLYRSLLYPLLSSSSATPVSVSVVGLAVIFNVFNSTILGGWIFMLSPVEGFSLSIRWVGGIGLFLLGFIMHVRSDAILRHLRRDHGPGYHVPVGFFYRWVSCPNYLGEILQWVGFAILVNAFAGWTFVAWTVANLVPRAVKHHRWYIERFDDYPSQRRAIFPGIL